MATNASSHSYGSGCKLANQIAHIDARDDTTPHLNAHFFYNSLLPIDDPLSAIPTPTDSITQSAKQPPRPFSAYDNAALEAAWTRLASDSDRANHSRMKDSRKDSFVDKIRSRRDSKNARESAVPVEPTSGSKDKTRRSISRTRGLGGFDSAASGTDQELERSKPRAAKSAVQNAESMRSVRSGRSDVETINTSVRHRESCDLDHTVRRSPGFHDIIEQDDGAHDLSDQGDAATDASGLDPDAASVLSTDAVSGDRPRYNTIDKRTSKLKLHDKNEKNASPNASITAIYSPSQADSLGANPEATTTGLPFARLHPSEPHNPPPTREPSPMIEPLHPVLDTAEETESFDVDCCSASNHKFTDAEVPVGVSRLHTVKLPALQMTPLYWSPVHDVATVTRATWFYRDSMLPVEAAVANNLESGYRQLKPWTQTWRDEVASAIRVGALGEEKIAHRLWPTANKAATVKGSPAPEPDLVPEPAVDPYCAARCFQGEVASEGSMYYDNLGKKKGRTAESTRKYPAASVVYKDAKIAFILKPTLAPNAYMGRRPVSKIQKGMIVGIPVIRGFDWTAWDKLHPVQKSQAAKRAEQAAPDATAIDQPDALTCPACRREEQRPVVSDLILVIHGIGQKLSERMESFHFTHAVNSFRREVNIELNDDKVKTALRKDLGGVMVLPVNWRHNVTFGSGSTGEGLLSADQAFSLADITPDTIPAVRNLISDVLLDIPYYLSPQNKEKMLAALILEANRVYRLWCNNNPGFQETGRVHMIAHSLGSAMALDVLSRQPTKVLPLQLTRRRGKPSKMAKHFEFNTCNLFFAGSPAALFLLLEKGKLVPRRNNVKADIDPAEMISLKLTETSNTFGCLAVENIYNIIAYNDPIAYRLNATVDPMYAASLKQAQVPNYSVPWFGRIAEYLTPGSNLTRDVPVGQLTSKPTVGRMPSQLEMESHDFAREDIAEKKMLLLNDNGQIDYYLSSGGGPLEIQYLNMLGAHSSYWTSRDFIRMLVTEVGRAPGKSNVLPNMRAVRQPHKAGKNKA